MLSKTNRYYTVISLALFAIFMSSCSSISMKKAEEHFTKKEYKSAAVMYKKLASSRDIDKADRQQAAYSSGDGFRLNHEPKNALKMYEKAKQYGAKDPMVLYRIAEMNKQRGNYQEAIAALKQYQKEAPGDPRTEVMIAGCEAAMKWKEEKSRYTVNAFKTANTSGPDDFSPMWADRRNKVIMFTSDREGGENKDGYKWTGRNYTDVWQIKLEGRKGREKWTAPTVVEGLNTKWNDGVICFNKRYNKMYITQCNGESGKERNCKIYEARKVGKGWEINEEPLSFCEGTTGVYSYGHPTLSPDNKTMYFSSNRPGGYGDSADVELTKDIWMVKYVRRGNTWGDPINLGPSINTAGNEMFPYMHSSGSLYFSSDGHPGVGGLDILEATKNGDGPTDWEVPTNMKSPINSEADDFGIIMEPTKEHGYFTSSRKNNQDDIYEFFMEPILCTLKGQVTDCDSGTAIADAVVVISNNIDSTKIRLRTDSKGYYETPIGINTEYTIKVSKRSAYYYDAEPQYVSTVGVENSIDCQHVKDFCMKNNCNDVFVLPIYYDLDKDTIRTDAEPILNDLINTLKKYPKMAVELGSHTDCRASYEYNIDLSQRRANQAIKYIVEKGNINPFRLEARGYGESQLVNHCACEGADVVPCTEEEHQKNRRTTVKVVNCNFDILSIGVDYKERNDAALGGKGSVYSSYLLEKQREYLTETKGNIDSFLRARTIADSIKLVEEEKAKYLAKYDFVPLSKSRDKTYTYGYVGRKKIKMEFNGEERRTMIPENLVIQMLNNKTLSVEDFKSNGDKIKLSNGMKIYSKSFTIKELKINDVVYTKVRCKMVDAGKPAVLGYNVFDDYIDFEIKDNKIWLLKDDEE